MRPKIMFVGRTASGKSSVAAGVCKRLGLKQVKSATTRPPRNERERNGISDHIFLSEQEFDQIRPEDIVAYTEINGYRYCTTFQVLDECDVYVIDPEGIRSLKERAGDRYRLLVVYIDLPYEEAKRRYEKRGGDDFETRYRREADQFDAFEEAEAWDLKVTNLKLQDSVDTIAQYLADYFPEA